MLNRIALAFCVLLALSGCSSSGRGMNSSNAAAADFEKNVGDRVHFGFDKHDLTTEAKLQLDRQAAWLTSKERSSINVVVEGHCDERGTREYNLALGEKRANSAKNYLVSRGVAASRVETISYGKERPAAIGNSDEVYQLNRRAVTVIK